MTVTDLAPAADVTQLRERYRAFMEEHILPVENRLEGDDDLVAGLRALAKLSN